MNRISERMSPALIRFLYTAAALIVFAVCVLNFYVQMFERVTGNDQCRWIDKNQRVYISDIVYNGVSAHAGLQDGDVLAKINGQTFKTGIEAQQIINQKSGSYVTYTIERNGVQFETSILILKLINVSYLAQFLYGVGFLIVGLVVVLVKPGGKLQRLFARFSILSMLFFGFSAMNINPLIDPIWQMRLLGISFLIGSVFAPPLFVRFFFYFPIARQQKTKWLNVVLYVVSIIIASVFVLFRGDIWPRLVGTALFVRYAFYVAGFLIFIHSYYKLVERNERKNLRPILIGVVLGIIVFLYTIIVGTVNPFAAFLNPLLLLPLMLLVIVPVLFGYAIFRHGLMDMDTVVQRSLTYGAVTAVVAAIYLLTVFGLKSLLSYFYDTSENRVIDILSLAVIAIVFDPIKQRFQLGIDRVFYRERYDYQRALLEFTQELPRLLELDKILHSIVSRISSTMHIEKVAVTVCGLGDCSCVANNIDPVACEFKEIEHGLIALLRKSGKPVDWHAFKDTKEFIEFNSIEKDKLVQAGVVFSVPMFLQDQLVGFINIGPKMSGRGYSQEDIDLLSTVGGQAAIAIENARLHKAELEQERIKEELDLARNIQQGLFPKTNPTIAGLDIAGTSVPALSVGGDYYDFIQLSPTKILTVVADVSGKGMSAALYMSKIQGMVQLAAYMYNSPKEMLKHINRRIFEGIDRKSFITMILAVIDTKKKEVRLCRAGHNKAMIVTNNKVQFLQGAGIALGLERGPVFEDQLEEVRIPLKRNTLFLLYTDGITEAMNAQKQELGEEPVAAVLKKMRTASAVAIERAILKTVEIFRGSAEQHDDVTMVVVKRTAERRPKKKQR
jgi:phosphoserine phosphatase RsbU/P